jgi:hypothetical protein
MASVIHEVQSWMKMQTTRLSAWPLFKARVQTAHGLAKGSDYAADLQLRGSGRIHTPSFSWRLQLRQLCVCECMSQTMREGNAILIMNLMLRARTLSGVPRDITVWETHYGHRPNVEELLLGPFGCLTYLILTKETRQRKGMSTYWGVKAIPGIYLGCEVNPRTMVYHHIITDGKTIFSSPNRIKPVPDVYPMRLHLESSPEDNKAWILLTENENSSAGRCKHIVTKFRFVAETISDGVVKIWYTPSTCNYSDILNKPLTEVMFQRMTETCLGSKDSQIVECGHQMEGFLCTGYDSFYLFIMNQQSEN